MISYTVYAIVTYAILIIIFSIIYFIYEIIDKHKEEKKVQYFLKNYDTIKRILHENKK